MAMGRRSDELQRSLWIPADQVQGPGHPFYTELNKVLAEHDFDAFVEELCRLYYSEIGRPSIPPGVFFRILLIGYFEQIESDRGMAWRISDSLGLREFLGYEPTKKTPDHSTISRTRRLFKFSTHRKVFAWVMKALTKSKLLRGKTVGVDATTIEANAAMRSIRRRTTQESYEEYLRRVAASEGLEDPTREELARHDRKRKKKTSNQDWEHPHDPDARIARMKDGRTRMAHKAEHAVDMDTGAIIAVTVQPADRGDTTSIEVTLDEAKATLEELLDDEEVAEELGETLFSEIVADKGYHSNAVVDGYRQQGIRTYIAEPNRGRRRWAGKPREQQATYANRRRIRSARGRHLLRQRGAMLERPFAQCYDQTGMRRTHLRGHKNIEKRLLINAFGFNLSLIMRQRIGSGSPRGLRRLFAALCDLSEGFWGLLSAFRLPHILFGPPVAVRA